MKTCDRVSRFLYLPGWLGGGGGGHQIREEGVQKVRPLLELERVKCARCPREPVSRGQAGFASP